MIKLLLADSNELIRVGLRSVFDGMGDCTIVAEATSNKDLSKQLKKHKPNVVLIDYTSPDFSIDIIPDSLSKYADVKFVAITYEQTGFTLVNAIRSGVTSYIKKDCDLDEIRDAVKETAEGGKFFCGKILETIRNESIDVADIDVETFTCAPIQLSHRELEIITLIAEGCTNTAIAEKLFLSSHTITTHRKNIMNKLGVNNTAAIVMYAVKNNLVSPNKFLFSKEV